MKLALGLAVFLSFPLGTVAAEPINQHFPVSGAVPAGATAPGGGGPAFSGAVMAGSTLYISGATDMDRTTGASPQDPKVGAQLVLNSVKRTVENAGLTMDDLVWVQIFCSDLTYYAPFNAVYRSYFKGPLPARAFLGVDHLLGGAHFEIMGIAARPSR